MKTKSIFICLLVNLIFGYTFAQKSSRKTINLPDDSKLVYTLEDNSYTGLYEAKNSNGDIITRGNYLNDQRVGNWYFLNSDNSLFLRYNYDNKKVLFLDDKSIAFASIKINTEKEEDSKLASIPLPLISIEQYVTLLAALVKEKIPTEVKRANEKLKVDIIAEIDESGKASYLVQYLAAGKERTQRFDLLGQKYTIEWIPASLKDKKLSSKFSFNTEYAFPKEEKGQLKRINWGK